MTNIRGLLVLHHGEFLGEPKVRSGPEAVGPLVVEAER